MEEFPSVNQDENFRTEASGVYHTFRLQGRLIIGDRKVGRIPNYHRHPTVFVTNDLEAGMQGEG